MDAPSNVLDLRKLKEHRISRGLSISELARGMRVNNEALSSWERGRNLMPLDAFQRLCALYRLDHFEVTELLFLKPIGLDYLKSFRAACKKEGLTPLQVLFAFVKAYAGLT